MIRKAILCFIVLSLFSCSSFKEVHYFSDDTPGIPNYYRLKISGFSFISSSRYLSGYYEPNAVNQYFNEFKQPTTGPFNTNLNAPAIAAPNPATVTGTNQLVESDGKEKTDIAQTPSYSPFQTTDPGKERLVLIYSTNSSAVSNQIGMITDNEETMDALALLLFNDQFDAQRSVEVQNAVSKSRNQLLVSLGGTLVDSLNPTIDSKAKALSSLLQYVNAMAMELGNTSPFANLVEAQLWLDRNRSGILNSTK